MHRISSCAAVALLAIAAAAVSAAADDRRVALIIGNSDYRSISALRNPRHDAEAVADALRQDGFQSVILQTDLDRAAMRDALRTFHSVAMSADWAVVYFAGHGLEIGGTGWLVPIDARLRNARDVEDEAMAYGDLIAAVEGARELRIVITDADRNNPFGAAVPAPDARPAPGPLPEQKAGTLLVFSTKAGEVTTDGDGAGSPFATALVAQLKMPGLEVRRLFDYVRDEVMDATDRRQQPLTYGSLPGWKDLFFVERKEGSAGK